MEWYPKSASVTLTLGAAVAANAGLLTNATAGTTRVFGIIQTSIVSSDSDFSSTKKVAVILPQENDEFEVDLTGTTFTTTLGLIQCDLDATGQYADLSATSHKQVTVLRQGSSTSKAIVKINGAYSFANAS